jgi:predicted nuclease with TOPRIM domain
MESLNEIKRIQELMGIKTLINEQYVKLWSIYKYGDDLIKGGDELKSTIDKLSGKLSSTEKTILKNNDEINRILRKANSDLTAAETRFIQTAEKALTKLSQQEIGVFRRNVIGNLISKDPQYVKMNQGIINRIENFVAMRKPTEEFLPSGEQKFEKLHC